DAGGRRLGDAAPGPGALRRRRDSRARVQRHRRGAGRVRRGGTRRARLPRQALRPPAADRPGEADRPGLTGFDRHLERWVVHHRAGGLDDVFVWLSRIGTLGLVWIGIGIALALLRRRPSLLLAVLAADGIADVLARAIKSLVDVQRPAFRYAEPKALVPVPRDHSFPSGH